MGLRGGGGGPTRECAVRHTHKPPSPLIYSWHQRVCGDEQHQWAPLGWCRAGGEGGGAAYEFVLLYCHLYCQVRPVLQYDSLCNTSKNINYNGSDASCSTQIRLLEVEILMCGFGLGRGVGGHAPPYTQPQVAESMLNQPEPYSHLLKAYEWMLL